MKSKVILFLIVAVCLGLTVSVSAQKVKAPKVNLSVEFGSVTSTNVQTNVYRPNTEPNLLYQNGLEGVTAVILENGHFAFDSGNKEVSFSFVQGFNVDEPKPIGVGPDGSTSTVKPVTAQTGPISASGTVALQDMPYVNGPTRQCMALSWEMSVGGNLRQIGFNYYRGDKGQSSYVIVTRLDADTWTIEPEDVVRCYNNDPGTIKNLATIRDVVPGGKGKTVQSYYGQFYLPFSLTLRRVQ